MYPQRKIGRLAAAVCCLAFLVACEEANRPSQVQPNGPKIAVIENPMPRAQKDFCGIISDSYRKYSSPVAGGANELKLSQLRSERTQLIRQAVPDGLANGWLGIVSTLKLDRLGRSLPQQVHRKDHTRFWAKSN